MDHIETIQTVNVIKKIEVVIKGKVLILMICPWLMKLRRHAMF